MAERRGIMNIRVECYSGRKEDERPIKFWLSDGVLFVDDVVDQWYQPHARYFRVRADDGNTYVLRHDEVQDQWALESFRAENQGLGTTDSDAQCEPN